MFDIGGMEFLLVLIIMLLVIGPERMPEVARKLGQGMGKVKRFVNSMKEDSEITSTVQEIQSSMNLDEHRKEIAEISQTITNDIDETTKELDMNDFHRPFGGEVETTGASQFNRAPSQPVIPEKPKAETATQAPAQPAEVSATPNKKAEEQPNQQMATAPATEAKETSKS